MNLNSAAAGREARHLCLHMHTVRDTLDAPGGGPAGIGKIQEHDMRTLQEAAEYYLGFFELRETETGTAWRVRDAAPPELKRMVRSAHGDFMPDDHRYRFIVEALRALAECDDPECARAAADRDPAVLTGWLHSKINRLQYMTIAMTQSALGDSLELLCAAQQIERNEVLQAVLGELRSLLGT
mgnify:CR=1 FL=1